MRRWFTFLLAFGLALAAAAQDRYPQQDLKFGVRVPPDQWAALESELAAHPSLAANPVGVTLTVPSAWAKSPDWPAFDAAVKAVNEARARLCVTTQLPDGPSSKETMTYLVTLSEHAGPSADALGLSLDREQFPSTFKEDPDKLALMMKELTVALRGKSEARILLGEVAPEDLPLLEPLYARNLRAYVEGYSSEATGPTGEPSGEVVHFLEAHHLGAPLLLHLPRVENAIAAQLLVLVSASRGVTYTDVAAGNLPAVWEGLLALREKLTPRMGPGFATEATSIRDSSGPRPDIGLINLLDPDTMVQGMVLVPTVAGSRAAALEIHLPTADLTNPEAYPLPSGQAVSLGYKADQKKQETVLNVPWNGRPLLVLFGRLKTGTVGEEKLSVSTTYTIPVEVIIARYQAVQEAQEVFLDNYTSDAQVDYHFQFPGGTWSLNVTFENSFLYQKGVGARWVQNRLLVNGVAWKGKKIPQLPIIEPEKVNTLPLALTLGRDYAYRYVGRASVDGHDCYEVEFVPLPAATGSVYSGKVWIDQRTFAKIRMTVSQKGLQEPMVSNDETDFYAPYTGPDGKTYWLLNRVRGQQLFSVGGRNIMAEREIHFSQVAINVPNFQQELAKAEASDKPMLQETAKGLRYLVKEKNGTRQVQMQQEASRWFAVGGTYWDKSLSFPVPLIGVNYFNYDWKHTKTQVNLFAAGAVNTLTVSKVGLFPRIDGGFTGYLFLVPFQDRYYQGGVEARDERVDVLRETATGNLGWRIDDYSKLSLDVDARYYRYSKVSQTAWNFRLPKDHGDVGAGLSYTFAWKGWSAEAQAMAHHRTSWEPWGLPGQHENASKFKDYSLWSVDLSKNFYLPYFQKISTGLNWMDGSSLDRFSQYQFTYLGSPFLPGFAGSGVRFDRGAIGSLGYEFNITDVIRLGLTLDRARVEPIRGSGLWQNHTGLGFSGAVTGPWQTYWTLDVGYALQSDIVPVRHDYTMALVVLKLW
ncbi:MAG: hypothetical protein WBS54_05250 [Acidobacteriota bacterium]